MKVLFRITALVLALTTALMFAACSKQDADSASKSASKSTSKASTSGTASSEDSAVEGSTATSSEATVSYETRVMSKGELTLKTVANIKSTLSHQGRRTVVREGNYLYSCINDGGKSYLVRYDVTGATQPKELQLFNRKDSSEPNFFFGWVAIKGDYIYCGARNYEANVPNPDINNGKLVIVNKKDFKIATNAKVTFPNNKSSYQAEAGEEFVWENGKQDKTRLEQGYGTFDYKNGICNFNFKVSRVIVYKNILIVNLQMRGWCAFAIDPKDPSKLTLASTTFWSNYEYGSYEHQGGQVFEANGKTYYFAIGFAAGNACYDITDIYNPKVVYDFVKGSKQIFTERNKLYSMIQEDFPNKTINAGVMGLQFFNVVVDYPNAYCTLSTGTRGQGTENAFEAIITYDITDIANGNIVVKDIAYLPEENHVLYRDTDVPPTTLAKVGDYIFVGCLEQGLGVFKIDNNGVARFNMMLTNEDMGINKNECLGLDNIFTTGENEFVVLNCGGRKHTPGAAYDPIDEVSITVPRILVVTVEPKK